MDFSLINFMIMLCILFCKTGAETLVHSVVALDGSGNFTNVMNAIQAAPDYNLEHYVIFVKSGTYNERVNVSETKTNIMLIGEGMDTTIISNNVSVGKRNNISSYDTATFAVFGHGFIAKNISFRNTAGPENYQAVALYSNSNRSAFYHCGIYGYQDTLLANEYAQFYRECRISGTIDFIYGHAAAVFQNCHIIVKKGLWNQKNTITAQGGGIGKEPFGFSFQFCTITPDPNLIPSMKSTQSFLGRPWKPHSRVIFMQSYISNVLSPEGWLKWNGTKNLDTLYFAEYLNSGPGARVNNRVKWPTYHILQNSSQAVNFTVEKLILGEEWLPLTGIPFTLGFGRGVHHSH